MVESWRPEPEATNVGRLVVLWRMGAFLTVVLVLVVVLVGITSSKEI